MNRSVTGLTESFCSVAIVQTTKEPMQMLNKDFLGGQRMHIGGDSATEKKHGMITSKKIRLQKLLPGMWTSYQHFRQVSRLGH